jgi:hypothetical protein
MRLVRCQPQSPRHARRGVAYVLVLSIALIVTTIGVSTLLLSRTQQRAMRMAEQAAEADLAAQSLADITVFRLANNLSWRTTYTNNVWTPNEIVGSATFRLRLVDELDGDLADDANDPVRLYAKATVGEAVRLYSVQLAPAAPANLLSNPGMEDGTANWIAWYCDLEGRSDQVHSGTRCLHVYNRNGYWSCPYQALASAPENGVAYQFRAWVRMDSGTSGVILEIETSASGSGTRYFDSATVSVGTTWTQLTANLTPSWSGTLNYTNAIIYTSSGNTSFRVDDVSLVKASTIGQMAPVPGTWRREVLP